MANSRTKKKTSGLTTEEVRNLIHEIITFSNDKIGTTTAQLMNDGHLDREQAERVMVTFEAVVKEAAFQVLSTKNL
tara:strand:+ start:4331 stop:4558 length:228 start_codon:yes stop_codon:yes gene_type:complete